MVFMRVIHTFSFTEYFVMVYNDLVGSAFGAFFFVVLPTKTNLF